MWLDMSVVCLHVAAWYRIFSVCECAKNVFGLVFSNPSVRIKCKKSVDLIWFDHRAWHSSTLYRIHNFQFSIMIYGIDHTGTRKIQLLGNVPNQLSEMLFFFFKETQLYEMWDAIITSWTSDERATVTPSDLDKIVVPWLRTNTPYFDDINHFSIMITFPSETNDFHTHFWFIWVTMMLRRSSSHSDDVILYKSIPGLHENKTCNLIFCRVVVWSEWPENGYSIRFVFLRRVQWSLPVFIGEHVLL